MPKLLFALCCKGTHGRNVQWPPTIFMVHEIFIVTTSGEWSSPPGSVHMCKSKLIFKLPCPDSAAISRAAAPLDESLLKGRTWQDTEIVAPWGTDETKVFWMWLWDCSSPSARRAFPAWQMTISMSKCYGAFIYKVFWWIKGYFLFSQTVEQSGQCIAQKIQFYFQLWQWHKIHDWGQFTSPTVEWGKESCFTYLKKCFKIHWLKKNKNKKPSITKASCFKAFWRLMFLRSSKKEQKRQWQL